MAVPKRKTGRAVRDARRATHNLSAPAASVCPQCHEPKLPAPRVPIVRLLSRSRDRRHRVESQAPKP